MQKHHENVVPNINIGVRFYESNVKTSGYVPFHWHSSIEMVCLFSGQLEFNFNSKKHIVGPQQFIAIPSGVIHDVTNSPNQALVLQIPLPFLEPYYKNPERFNFKSVSDDPQAYEKVMKDFYTLNLINKRRSNGYLFDFGAVVLHILKILTIDFRATNDSTDVISSNLKDLISFINLHYSESLTVNELAQKFGYNPNYLSRIFKQQVGLTLVDYLYKVRLNALYHDLLNTNLPIEKLFIKEGLTNAKMTRKLFKEIYNCLPSQVRQKSRK